MPIRFERLSHFSHAQQRARDNRGDDAQGNQEKRNPHDTGRGRSRPATKSSTSSERMSASTPRDGGGAPFPATSQRRTAIAPARRRDVVHRDVNGSNAFFEHELNLLSSPHRARCYEYVGRADRRMSANGTSALA